MRNIGLASIEAVRPQLGQNSNVPHKTSLHAKFQVISSIGGRFTAPPCPRIWTLLPPFYHQSSGEWYTCREKEKTGERPFKRFVPVLFYI